MNIYEYAPQKNFKKITGVVLILACAAVGLFFVPSVFPKMPYRWVLQLLGFGCVAGVIYISTRYITKNILYGIFKRDDGGLDLTVTELTSNGKRRITVCRISLENIEEVRTLQRGNATDKLMADRISARAKSEHRRVFNYNPEIGARNICYVLTRECGEPLLIKLASDRVLERYLREGAETSKEVENEKDI